MCEVFAINRSAYYAWLKRPPSDRKIEDNVLSLEIKRISKESYGTYGARRIKEQLKKDGFQCGKTSVLDYNNGLAEGSVNKLNTIKRIMHGRNNFKLL